MSRFSGLALATDASSRMVLIHPITGQPLPDAFSEATARELYAEPTLSWLRDQAQTWVDDLGNYAAKPLKGSSTSPGTSSASTPASPTAEPSAAT